MTTRLDLSSTELERLLSDLFDGRLDDSGRYAFRTLLKNNSDARDAYLSFMTLHVHLHLDFGNGLQAMLPRILGDQPSLKLDEADVRSHAFVQLATGGNARLDVLRANLCRTSTHDSKSKRGNAFRSLRTATIALLTACIAGGASFWFLPTQPDRPGITENEQFTRRELDCVAVLAQAANAKWSRREYSPQVGGSLPASRLKLDSGLVQVEFFSGATVVVEAPADFELASPMKMICHLGKIRATVPRQAHGFRIETPKYTAVDLGTEFTVRVGADGESEIHVISGEVELWDHQRKDAEFAERLTTGRGVQSVASGELAPIVNSASKFIDREQCLTLSQADLQKRFDQWKSYSNRIRQDERVIVYYGFDGHAPWERTVRNDGKNVNGLLDGAIVGCHWTTGRWDGKQALEFKRTTDRIRLNVPGEFESLTFAAWIRLEGLERWLSSLMLADGHQVGEVHWQITEVGQLMLGVKTDKDRSEDYYSPSVLGAHDLGRWVHLGCVYDGADRYVSHYVDGEEISREKVRQSIRLSIGAAEIGNWSPEKMQDNRIRSLNGRLDEFILFDSPLSTEQMREIYVAGKPQ